MITVAIPSAYQAELAPVLITYELATDDPALDLTTATAVRAIITRPDGVVLEWTFDIEASPAPTSTAATVSAAISRTDLFTAAGLAVPGTYDVRFFVTVPAGEYVLSRAYLTVETF